MLSFVERCKLDSERLALLTAAEREANAASHCIGVVDDCYRCLDCEIGAWNSWKAACHV